MTFLLHFLFIRFLEDPLQRCISYLERKILLKEHIMTELLLIPKMCFFTWDHKAVCSSIAAAKQHFLLLNYYIFSLQSLPSDSCRGSEGTVTEVGCTTGKTHFFPCQKCKAIPRSNSGSQGLYGPLHSQILTLLLVASGGCPSGPGSMV